MDQLEQILGTILQSVPPDVLLAFMQILSQMEPQEIQPLMQMIAQAVQQQGGGGQPQPQQQQQETQGNANLYGG